MSWFLVCVELFLVLGLVSCQSNYCVNCNSYLFGGSDCSYDPTINQNTVQIAQRLGLIVNSTILRTYDGYHVSLLKIYSPNAQINEEPVLFLHGLATNTKEYFLQNLESLGVQVAQKTVIYVLSFRGNEGSTGHDTLNSNNPVYWNFTMEETRFDIEAALSFIKSDSSWNTIRVVCHSIGCSIFAIGCHFNQQLVASVSRTVFISPLIYTTQHNTTSLQQLIFRFPAVFRILEALTSGRYELNFVRTCMGVPNLLMTECVWFYRSFFGASTYIDYCRDVPFLSSSAGVIPAKYITQLTQNNNAAKFQRYDYGQTTNNQIYGQPIPPQYDLSKLTMFKTFIAFDNDNVISPSIIVGAALDTPNPKETIIMPNSGHMSHVDSMRSNGLNQIADIVLGQLGIPY